MTSLDTSHLKKLQESLGLPLITSQAGYSLCGLWCSVYYFKNMEMGYQWEPHFIQPLQPIHYPAS